MAFTVSLYNFGKNANSTARPAGTGTSYNCILKSPSGIHNPVIKFNRGLTTPPTANYAYIPTFSRYYYITEWKFEDALWEAYLQVDVLATYRSEIGSSEQYVLRAAAAYDVTIMDNLYPTRASVTNTYSSSTNPWVTALSSGTYVVGIINSASGGVGAVKYYTFTQTQFNRLCNYLFSSADWIDIDITEISDELLKALFNPFEYIVSCMWFPFTAPSDSSVANLQFGWWTLPGISAGILANVPIHSNTVQFSIPKHPQTTTRGTYLNLSPYARYSVEFKPWGMTPIDTTHIISSTSLYALYYVDCISGVGTMSLSTSTSQNNNFNVQVAQVGVPIQLAQISRDYLGIASTALQGAGSVIGNLATGNIAGAITGGISAIESTIRSSLPQVSTTGGNGSISDFIFTPKLTAQFFPLVDENIDTRGRPLCTNRTISTLPGYILTANAHVDIAGTSQESTTIENYMNGGFYYD